MLYVLVVLMALIALVLAATNMTSAAATIEAARAAQEAAQAAQIASGVSLVGEVRGLIIVAGMFAVALAIIWAVVTIKTAESKRKPPVTINPRPSLPRRPQIEELPDIAERPQIAGAPTMQEMVMIALLNNLIGNNQQRRENAPRLGGGNDYGR